MKIYNENEKQEKVNALKQLLTNSDYKALKAFEGSPSEDWDEVKVHRENWRKEVDRLEKELIAEYFNIE